MAGWNPEQIMAAVPSMVDLATISGTDLGRMADLISDTATALGIRAGDKVTLGNGKVVDAMQHYTDSWAYAITNANLDTETLGLSMKYNGAAMHQAGLSQGDIFAANMIAANFGSKGSMSGTAFRSGMIRLQAPAKKGAQALEEMGLNASEAQKEMAAAGAAMAKLDVQGTSVMDKMIAIKQRFDENKAAGNSDANAAMINDIFGKNAFQTWASLMDNANLEQMQKWAAEMNSGEIEGWTADTAGVMRESANVQFELLKSAIDACAESLGHIFLPAAVTAFQTLASGASAVNEWIQNNQTAVQWLGLLAAALSAAIVGFAGLGVASAAFSVISSGAAVAGGAITTFVGLIGAARTAIMSLGAVSAISAAIATAPIWAIAAAIIGVIGIIGYATGAFDGLGDAIANAWNHPKGAVTGFCEMMKSAVGSAVQYVVDRWNTLKSALSHPIDAVINFLDHGDVVGGNVKGYQQGQELSQVYTGGGVGAIQAQIPPETSTAVQTATESLNQLPPPVQYTAEAMNQLPPPVQYTAEAMNQLPPPITQAGEGLNNVGQSSAMTAPAIDTVGQSSMMTAPAVDTLGQSSQGSSGNIQALGGVAMGACVNIAALSGSASAVAGALSAKAAEIASIRIPQPQVEVIHTTVQAAANYRGGIYPKGQFLTTFAEKSPEAAIPIDNSQRARDLWLATGQLLGINVDNILPDEKPRRFPYQTPPTFPTDNPRPPINIPIPRRTPINFPFPYQTPPTFPTDNPRRTPINFPFPYQTPPTFPTDNQPFPTLETPTAGAANISININVTIQGNADEGAVQRGIEDALPRVESFAEKLAAYQHERARVSYA